MCAITSLRVEGHIKFMLTSTRRRPTIECETKWLPWRSRLPSNGVTKCAIYDQIFPIRKRL